MIEYSKTAADNKKRIRDLTWMNARLFAILPILILPVSLYYFVAGTVVNSPDAVRLGGQLLTLAVVCVAIYIIVYSKTKKVVNANFEENEIDGKIDFTVERIDEETLEFTRLTDEESFRITRADIKSIKRLKSINVIILNNKRTIDLPKQVDIDELITL